MPNPVPIPTGPLSVSEKDVQRAEELLSAIVQVIHSGTSGANPPTYPTLVPSEDPTKLKPLVLATDLQQQQYRQLAVAIAKVVSTWSTEPDPDPPDPEVVDPLLIKASCDVSVVPGDIVVADNAAQLRVRKADPTSETGIPAIGVVESKESATSCFVRVGGITDVFSSLVPGKVYFLGRGGTITSTPLKPETDDFIFHQEIGVAVQHNQLLVAPSTHLTKIRSNS